MHVCMLIGHGCKDDNSANLCLPCDSAATAKLWKDLYESRGWRGLYVTGWYQVETYDSSKQLIAELSKPTAEDEAFNSIPGALTL